MPLATPTMLTARDEADLHQRVAEAIADRAAPISTLLRLFWALESGQDAANQNARLREQLRARIGAPYPN